MFDGPSGRGGFAFTNFLYRGQAQPGSGTKMAFVRSCHLGTQTCMPLLTRPYPQRQPNRSLHAKNAQTSPTTSTHGRWKGIEPNTTRPMPTTVTRLTMSLRIEARLAKMPRLCPQCPPIGVARAWNPIPHAQCLPQPPA
jgi:hypothetical protein